MCDVPPLPVELRKLVKRGIPPQRAMAWNRASWIKWLKDVPDHTILSGRALPAEISRKHVAEVFQQVGSTHTITDAFVAAMAWGYGPIGYGPYRTHRVLITNADAPARLRDVLDAASAGDGKAAFNAARAPGLKHLGPAFGTKFLYFASLIACDDDAILPILDSVVVGWFRKHTSFRPRSDVWRWMDYECYLKILKAWSGELGGVRIDILEQVIFDSAWRAGAVPEPSEDLHSSLLRVRELSAELPMQLRARVEAHLDALDELVGETNE